MRCGLIGDTHFGVRGGDPAFLQFQLNWFEKTLRALAAAKVFRVIQVGDMFDNRKMLDVRVAQAVDDMLSRLLPELGIQMDILVGNHNIFYRDQNDVTNLFFLRSNPNINIINEYLEEDDVLFVAWMNKQNTEKLMKVVEASTAEYCIGHFEFDGCPMSSSMRAPHGLSMEPFTKFTRVLSGHYHTVSQTNSIYYLGSPYHITWSDYPDGTNRGFFILDTKKNTLDMVANGEEESLFSIFHYDPQHSYAPEDIVHLSGRIVRFVVADRGDTRRYNKFLAAIKETKFIEFKIIDETMIDKAANAKQTIDPAKLMSNISAAFAEYTVSLAGTVTGADAAITESIAFDLYNKAVNK